MCIHFEAIAVPPKQLKMGSWTPTTQQTSSTGNGTEESPGTGLVLPNLRRVCARAKANCKTTKRVYQSFDRILIDVGAREGLGVCKCGVGVFFPTCEEERVAWKPNASRCSRSQAKSRLSNKEISNLELHGDSGWQSTHTKHSTRVFLLFALISISRARSLFFIHHPSFPLFRSFKGKGVRS
jgi:hypothetical protein